MSDRVCVELLPLNAEFTIQHGALLYDHLFAYGVEFPCGGRARCKGCKIRVINGGWPASEAEARLLTEHEIANGWRLACQTKIETNTIIELAQWEAPVLTDNSRIEFTPRTGLGVAVDLGTTTIVAQMLDLNSGQVLGVRTALNAQARHGSDIMSRVEFGVAQHGQSKLTRLIRNQVGKLIEDMLDDGRSEMPDVTSIVIVGNTVMHHIFCGIDLQPLSHYPFEPEYYGLQIFHVDGLGWNLKGNPIVRFLPCLGGFVGSDILAGVLATKIYESADLTALIDLGTNGEILIGNSQQMICASTAAGPAFEGARISLGMRAATGAISEVSIKNGSVECAVIGGGSPRGICGSGLVDAVAAGLELGWIAPSGKLVNRTEMALGPRVALSQRDVRELQLAKGAIAAGLQILLARWGATLKDLKRIYLAGAFGNNLNCANARRIGLVRSEFERVVPAGNTALRGAKMALFDPDGNEGDYSQILKRIEHVSLNEKPGFEEAFVGEMRFPDGVRNLQPN